MSTQPDETRVMSELGRRLKSGPGMVANLVILGFLVVIFTVIIGFVAGFSAGQEKANNDGVRMFNSELISDGSVVASATVVQVDPNADTSQYPGISSGDFITVVLSASEFGKLQGDSSDMTICKPDGVAISAFANEQNLLPHCGDTIHVVLFK